MNFYKTQNLFVSIYILECLIDNMVAYIKKLILINLGNVQKKV